MNNPFKAGDVVTTKVKGQPVEATVNQVWNQEVQVRTADKKLLWRTVKTVTLVSAAVALAPKGSEEAMAPAAGETKEAEAPPFPATPPQTASMPEKAKRKSKVKSGPSLTYPRVRSRPKRPKI